MQTRGVASQGMLMPRLPRRRSTAPGSNRLPRRPSHVNPRCSGPREAHAQPRDIYGFNVGCSAHKCDREWMNESDPRERNPRASQATSPSTPIDTGHPGGWMDMTLSALSMAIILANCDPVFAAMAGDAEALAYNPEQGSETFKNIAGVGYIILVVFYFFRLFRKRAERATTEALASTAQAAKDKTASDASDVNELAALDGEPVSSSEVPGGREGPGEVSVTQCLIGVAQAGAICFGFYMLSKVVDDFFLHQDIPTQYTARNVTLLIQSVVRGLVYLVTFIFGANATGLAALAIQLVVDPEGVDRGLDQTPRKKKEALPKVKVTDDIGSLRRAFKEAERMGQREKK